MITPCRTLLLVLVLVVSCVAPGPQMPASSKSTPSPTIAEPLKGLPALSADGHTLALPTFDARDAGQGRSITFIDVGDTVGTGKTIDLALTPSPDQITELATRLGAASFASMPWVTTPDNPPLPMTITVAGTELYFAGDPHAQLELSVQLGGHLVGRDIFHVEGETETSPEHVLAVGALVLWSGDHGFAYVRYDVSDTAGRDSIWRVVTLDNTPAGIAALAQPPLPANTLSIQSPMAKQLAVQASGAARRGDCRSATASGRQLEQVESRGPRAPARRRRRVREVSQGQPVVTSSRPETARRTRRSPAPRADPPARSAATPS